MNKNDKNPQTDDKFKDIPQNGDVSLDDVTRIKAVSPGMLVWRRFIRNRLAVAGMVMIIVMFLFSFVGPLLSPYDEIETFTAVETLTTQFGGVTVNNEFRFVNAEDVDVSLGVRGNFTKAVNAGNETFTYGDDIFTLTYLNEQAAYASLTEEIGRTLEIGGNVLITPSTDQPISPELTEAVLAAMDSRAETFELDGVTYSLTRQGKQYLIGQATPALLGSKHIISIADQRSANEIRFNVQVERALAESGGTTPVEFEYEATSYTLTPSSTDEADITKTGSDEVYAVISPYIVTATAPDIVLSLGFRDAALTAVAEGQTEFDYDIGSGTQTFRLRRENQNYVLQTESEQLQIDRHAAPSAQHWLGLDNQGMDTLTRLMYGGQVSLLIGFVVVLFSAGIGVVLGGLAGYFGGWVDMIVMRLVDVFYCLPTYPILIIVGSMMDSAKMPSQNRIYWLMLILGLLSWAGTARLVRGQILGLREQEFMVAAEATGISTGRRIFRHLMPNVMPQLIVSMTMSLGGTILTESTLSFLGLGVKAPYASWGNIINAVSNQFIMMNYPNEWIPAGLCILITVLGFNFVGDGLRDAFDPRGRR